MHALARTCSFSLYFIKGNNQCPVPPQMAVSVTDVTSQPIVFKSIKGVYLLTPPGLQTRFRGDIHQTCGHQEMDNCTLMCHMTTRFAETVHQKEEGLLIQGVYIVQMFSCPSPVHLVLKITSYLAKIW